MNIDPIGDFLTRIRNACMARHPKVDIPASRLKLAVAELLKAEGYIRGFQLFRHEAKPVIRIYLKYMGRGRSVIQGLRQVSKASRRVFVGYRHIPKVMSGLGMAILSTPQGVVSDKTAAAQKVGGEMLCSIW